MLNTCRNCNHHFKGNFCNECGQKQAIGTFTFKNIFTEAFQAFTHADKGIIKLLKNLLINPGRVAYEYITEGKRKKYFNLFTFFVIITAVAAFVENKDIAVKEVFFKVGNEYGQVFNVYSKVLTLLTIPLLAFVLWLINRTKDSLRYSEYTVFAMILMSVKSIIDIIARLVNLVFTGVFKLYTAVDENIFYAVFLMLFMGYASYNFHKRKIKNPWFRSLLSGFAFCIIQAALIIFIVWAILRNFNGLGIFSIYGISNS